nr:response regulator [Lachnospiraceae bacterium]
IGLDVAGLICLGSAMSLVCIENEYANTTALSYIRLILMTVYFVLVGGQHVDIMLQEYQRGVKENERKLQEQVNNAEAARAEAEDAKEKAEIARADAEEAKEEADAANQAKSRFLANMSHEIRTPINAVLGMDEMILRETKNKEVKAYAMDIRSAGNTLLSLINEILDYSKIESGKMELAEGEYDLPSVINNLVNMTTARAKGKDLDFVVEIDNNLPMKLWGDDVRLRQIITNILTNAVKYTPEGKFWLRMNGTRDNEDFILHVEVEDTGIGIKEEDIPKLFVEYERIEESRNRNIEGTGLGMNITLQLLSMMDSKLQVESVYGEGSKFFFDVKQRIIDDTPIGDFKAAVEKATDDFNYNESFIAPDAHVLVVDDNSMNRKVFMSLLKATEIQIDDADGGPQAVEFASQKHYDIIFMDHMMPDMDGVEAMKRIKAMTDGPCANTPIIVLTANAVSGAKESYLAEGFDGFMSKPVVADKLEQLIGETLPKEMLLPAPEREDKAEDTNPMPEDLPSIEGLDWPFAWLHLPGEDMLIDTVKDFYELIPVHGKKLAGFYEQLPSDEGFEAYRIQVHGMKSSAATIGIVPLAGMAKILEFAAKDFNEDIIRQVHPVFMNEWNSYREKMKGAFGLGDEDDSDKEDADLDKTKAYLEMLRLAMEDFDVDKADELMALLKTYKYPDEVNEKIEELGGAVTDLDSDLCNEIVAYIMEKI